MDNTAASTERTIHIRICHHLWIRAFNMYIFKIPGFYECPISWVHFISFGTKYFKLDRENGLIMDNKSMNVEAKNLWVQKLQQSQTSQTPGPICFITSCLIP